MKAYYEKNREQEGKLIVVKPCYLIKAHFHNNLEVFVVKSGNYQITYNGTVQNVSSGQVAFFDSYDVHSYDKKISDGENCVVLIPYKYIERFNILRNSKHVKNSVITNYNLAKKLYFIVENVFLKESKEEILQAGAELFLSYLYGAFEFGGKDFADGEAIIKILDYIYNNFKTGITVKTIAKSLGYSTEHVSRVFHKYLSVGLPKFINDLRLDYIENELMLSDKKKITDLIFEAGFKSVQSYYRSKSLHE